MRGRTCFALIFLLLLSAQSRAETACVDLAQLAHSTVGITRYFDEAERNAQSDVVGIHGTAWFQSPTNIVTVGHVATAMGLSSQDWKPLDIKEGADSKLISARIQRWIGGGTEKLVVLELQAAFPAARSVPIRTALLVPEDRLVTLAYPNQNPRVVSGRFVQYVTDGRLAGTALLEMYEGDNRFAVDHGASGAPVFDCEGRIAAVISTVITQIFQTPFGVLRTSTAWGTPNVVSVPVEKLMEFSKAQ
jgi:Trypsin-like peptidase domain